VATYRSSNKAVEAKYHITWCPKYRRRVLAGQLENPLKEIIAGVVGGGQVIEVGVIPDHAHMLVEGPPALALSKLVPTLEGRSSRVLSQELLRHGRLPALSSPWWFVSPVGGGLLEGRRYYVKNQPAVA
jgi:putative transposase